jgi:AcrR family transcriptional regulator
MLTFVRREMGTLRSIERPPCLRFAHRFTELVSCGKPSSRETLLRGIVIPSDVEDRNVPPGAEQSPRARGRGRPRREAAAPAIARATLELLAERGFQAATMDAIAERAGVSKNTIYRRWSSKELLIAEALRELTAPAEVARKGDIYASLLEHIRDVARILADPLVGRLLPGLLGELQRNPSFADAYADRVVRPRRQAIIDLIEGAIAQGKLRSDARPDEVADLLIGPLLLRHLFEPGLPRPPRRYPEQLLETIWAGIAPATGTST